jgi:PAS domain S-box-containing protein
MKINISDDLYSKMENISSKINIEKEEIISGALNNLQTKTDFSQPSKKGMRIFESGFHPEAIFETLPDKRINPDDIKNDCKTLSGHLLDCVYLLDFEGNFLGINDVALTLTKYSREELQTLNINKIIKDRKIINFFKNIEKVDLNIFHDKIIECRLRRKDGSLIDIEARISILYSDSKPFAILGIAHNITGLKRTLQTLKKTEEKFYKTFHVNPYPIVIATREEGRFIDFNNAFLSVFNYEKAEILGKTVYDLGIWYNIEERNTLKLNLFQYKGFLDSEITLFSKDKKILKCSIIVENIELDGALCWIFIFKSITEYKSADQDPSIDTAKTEKLREIKSPDLLPSGSEPEKTSPDTEIYSRSLTDAKKLLDTIADGILIIDENNCIINLNKSTEKILGCEFSRTINKPYKEIFKIMDADNIFHDKIQKGININKEKFRILNAANKPVFVYLSAFILHDNSGRYKGFTCGIHELSESEHRNKTDKDISFHGMVSRNKSMIKIFDMLPDIALSDSPVLLEGLTGTGKNLIAKAIHHLSSRNNKPFTLIHCGTLPVELFESELFGHIRGAFTDAKYNKLGKIAVADGGTVFFDEIGDLPYPLQVKLLRLIEDHQYESIGSTKTIIANIRIISATNKNLFDLVNKNIFRADLYYRLSTVKLYSPALKERKDDIPLLIDFFIKKYNAKSGKNISGVSDEVFKILLEYSYPGNIRELCNIFEYAFINCKQNIISLSDLPAEFTEAENPAINSEISEKDRIILILNKHNGNKIKACKELNISYATLFRKIKKYNLYL